MSTLIPWCCTIVPESLLFSTKARRLTGLECLDSQVVESKINLGKKEEEEEISGRNATSPSPYFNAIYLS